MNIYKKFSLFAICMVLWLLFWCLNQAIGEITLEERTQPEINWITAFPEGLTLAKSKEKSIMVSFYTDWCKWCKKLEETTYPDPEVVEFSSDLVCMKIDAGKDTVISKRLRIHGYPSTLFLESDGKEIDRIVGYLPPEKFLKETKDILERKNVFAVLLEREREYPKDIELMFALGGKFADRGMHEEAIVRFEKIVKLDPKNKKGQSDNAMFGIGRLYLRQKKYNQAIEEFETLISTYPKTDLVVDVRLYIGYCYEKKGDKDRAIAIYGKFASEYPESEDAEWATKRIEKLSSEEEEER